MDPLQEADRSDARFDGEWRGIVKKRLFVVLAVLAVWVAGVEARLVYLQVFSHDALSTRARNQQQDIIEAEAPRGDIVDRNGQLLAYSVESFDVIADPKLVKDPAGSATELCRLLADCSADDLAQITAKLAQTLGKTGKPIRWVVVRQARFVSPAAAERVRAFAESRKKDGVPAIFSLEPRARRYYPKKDLAAHVVGFLDATGKGGAGIEFKFDREIRGVSGRMLLLKDGRTDDVFTRVERAPVAGASLELTIDARIQHIAERELQAGIEASNADGGSVIVMDPQTGEILALASYPTFNPNVYGEFSAEDRRNRAVQDTYEPGSTFKIITASAVLNEGALRPTDLIDCNPGYVTFPGRVIREDKHHNYGVLTFEDVVVRSSNVGAIRAGLKVGALKMLDYGRRFGVGRVLATDFAGGQRGGVGRADDLDDSGLASVSMGYQVSMTPMQIATAASVIANGGFLIQPRAVRAVIKDGRRDVVPPKVLGRAITPETAQAMTAIMEGVVDRGTAKTAGLERYQVAGKTGTAKKIVDGRYSDTEYNVSFVGFVPSRRPAFTILVVIDTPRRGPAYGGAVAGPIFRRIADAALQYAAVPVSINPPPAIVVADRSLLPMQPIRATEAPALVINADGQTVMPDLRGLSLREALRRTNALQLSMTTTGDGVVMSQSPAPGAVIDPAARGALQLRRVPEKDGGVDR